jgi:hypothetical protein
MSEQELVKFGGGGVPANPDDLVAGLQQVTSTVTGGAGGPMLLKLKKTGVWAYGQENIEPEPGSLWAINPYSIEHGFACWGDGELFGEVMVPFNQLPPAVNTLQDFGEPWSQQIAMQLQCMTGEDKGVTVKIKGTSVGMRNAFKSLVNDIIAQAGSDAEHIVPVVELEVDSYQHKKYGEVFTPVLDVQQWVSIDNAEPAEAEAEPEMDDVEAVTARAAAEEDEKVADSPPQRRNRSAAKAEDKAPTRRRRRRA